MTVHEVLRVDFRALQGRALRGRPHDRATMLAKQVTQPPLERRLGTHNRQIDVLSGRQRQDIGRLGQIARQTGAKSRNAWIPWCHKDGRYIRVMPKAPG